MSGSVLSSLTIDHGNPIVSPLGVATVVKTQAEFFGRSLKTKKEIAKEVAEALDIPQTLAREAVQKTLDSILDGLVSDGRIELRKFGVFEIKDRAAKKGRNPNTGEPIMLPAKKVVTFKSGTEMDERVKRLSAKTLSEDREEGLERERREQEE
ncbi:DNA-binding protein HU 1 [Mariniblastus fucicola]|uniref:DNA-binding protein HU 1 n=1 Tax=Mariniblastus fucicola TaxID=980251 RepID=A0A5B9PF12_9BACT|nr:DNA-binding protein HU 1 [Mariniblastus fucicola]